MARILLRPRRTTIRLTRGAIPAGYLTPAAAAAAYDALGAAAAAQTAAEASAAADLAAHVAAADPHPGYALESAVPQYAPSTAQWTSTSTAADAVPGCSFTPEPGSVYLVEFYVSYYAAASGTGLGLGLDPGNAASGAATVITRNAGNSSSLYYGPVAAGINATGGTSSASPNRTPGYGWAILTADAVAPTPVQLVAASEVAGSRITIEAGEAVLRRVRLR